jgi:DNA-binding NarL/FixJ family response regulator
MTRVLVVDDHRFFRQTLVELVAATEDLEVVGECSDGSEVLAAVATLRPQVVLMDLHMQRMSGIEAAASLREEGSDARVIMLSSDCALGRQAAARSNGVAGYLLKGTPLEQLLDAVRHVARGGTVWPDGDTAA